MHRFSFCPALLALLTIDLTACGGSVSDSGGEPQDTTPAIEDGAETARIDEDTSPPGDTAVAPDTTPATDGPVDPHGAPSGIYPAFSPDLPILQNGGGALLKAPVFVTITYNSDPKQKEFDDFGDTIGKTAYWAAVTAEYGVGPAVSGSSNHVHIATAPPASVSDRDVRNLIAANAGGAWPAITDNSLYVYYAHSSSVVASFGGRDLCKSGVGGYHSSTTIGGDRKSVV